MIEKTLAYFLGRVETIQDLAKKNHHSMEEIDFVVKNIDFATQSLETIDKALDKLQLNMSVVRVAPVMVSTYLFRIESAVNAAELEGIEQQWYENYLYDEVATKKIDLAIVKKQKQRGWN